MKKGKMERLFHFSWRDFLILVAIMFCATSLCWFMRILDSSGEFATLIYVMAVLLVSRLTNGFLYGLIASILGVIAVNFLFTYPYREFNFTIAGYPLTFLTMLMVSIMTCTLTAQLKQQEKLRLENEREKMRANLLRSVSHDIRTPLTSIVGSTATILENPNLSQKEQRTLLEDARDEAQWLIRVVENLLSITRISGGEQAHITKEPEAAEEILGEAVRKFRKRFPEVTVTVVAPDTLLMVPMDPILIEQVLANLLENAVIHGQNTSCIQVSVCREGGWARFDVRDNGCGIPRGKLNSLFTGVLQESEETSGDKKRNMGLGLAVCTFIVSAHGGTMEADNMPEGGADLIFRLPLDEEEDA